MADIKADNALGHHQHEQTVDGPVHNPGKHSQNAKTFLLKIGIEPVERLVQLAADFAGVV